MIISLISLSIVTIFSVVISVILFSYIRHITKLRNELILDLEEDLKNMSVALESHDIDHFFDKKESVQILRTIHEVQDTIREYKKLLLSS